MDYKKFYKKEFRDRWKILAETSEPWLKKRIETALALLAPQRGDVILDVGCGDGVIPILAAKMGAKVVGIDLSEPSIRSARKHAKSEGVARNTKFNVGDVYNLKFANGTFNKVLLTEVLEHLDHPITAAREINRVLQPKGKLIVSVPTALHPSHLLEIGKEEGAKTKFAMLAKGGISALSQLFRRQGFITTSWRGAPHYHYLPGKLRGIISAGGFRVIESQPIIFMPRRITESVRALRKMDVVIEKTPIGELVCMTNNLLCEKK